MAWTIKRKIATGIGVLFALLTIISVLALIAINMLSDKTENLLTANYNTIRYCNRMMHAMDELHRSPNAVTEFENALKGQERNITEPGEREATQQLRHLFETLRPGAGNDLVEARINAQLYKIGLLNQRALEQKNAVALRTAAGAKMWLSALITLVLIAGLSLAFNLPAIVAAPVKLITDGIREIAKGNYGTRIELNNEKDEFGVMAHAFNRMAARLDEWENSSMARLMFEKSRVDSIINQMEDAVIGTDAEGRILFINHIASQLYNLSSDGIVGKPAAEIAAQNDLLHAVLESPPKSPLQIVVNGKEQFFAVAHKAVEQDDKSLGDVYTLKNITHFKELDLSKTNLLATISHELKTPISSIKLSAKLLADERTGNMNPEQLEMLGGITDDTDRLLRLTAELLNITQIETGNIQLRFLQVLPRVIVDEAVAAVSVQAASKRISIEQRVSDDLPMIQADVEKAALVLVNLLSNAVRYSPEGARIRLLVERTKASVSFAVQDEGEGIDPRYQSRIFERYFKVPGSINKSGTGLGLAISKEFIEAQGGTITVESEYGKGSTFRFELPAA
jgi:signal transduction histidine kinase/HAMP domain-containing protein